MRHGHPARRAYLVIGAVVALAVTVPLVWYAASRSDPADRSAAAGQPTGSTVAGGSTAVPLVGQPAPAPSPSPPATASPAPSTSRAAGMRTVTLVNQLSQTVWAAATRDSKHPVAATGWVLAPGARVDVAVPSQWSGRFWGRTGCSFDGNGKGHCQTGDCAGGFQCTGSGATPATLAEWTFGAWNGLDFYDVSLVDGSNLPMWINIVRGSTKDPVSTTGCVAAGCTTAVDCPEAMRVSKGGSVVACRTACAAFGTDDYCCRGAWSGRANCVPSRWPVDYTQVFKRAEPYAYSYAYDDSATMSCRGNCDYRITFGVSPS